MGHRGRATVMVVDDDAGVRELLREILQLSGLEVLCASDGRDALARLRCGDLRPDAIVLDLEMPVMNGWQFRSEQLRDSSISHIPVLVASGSDPDGIRADGHLRKPYDLDDLLTALDAMTSPEAAAG
jgi:CheY-like chemotaxis protein